MFQFWGGLLSRCWPILLVVWVVAWLTIRLTSQPFSEVAEDGDFVFLPPTVASQQAETLFGHAFPGRKTTSNIVVVARREEPNGLTDQDREFLTETLSPELQKIKDEFNGADHTETDKKGLVSQIQSFADQGIGKLMISEDRMASLISVDLSTYFQDVRNREIVRRVEAAVTSAANSSKLPEGLKLDLTGSATLGRDLSKAEWESARNTSKLTIVLVILLLVIIYRAPLLAIVPLVTLFIAVDMSLHLLSLLAQYRYVSIFMGLQEYTTVITYGPGIDYCLFLIARYKENLEECVPPKEALSRAMGQVGPAILASAATVICGIGMLSFAEFGKFHEAGIGISLALTVTLLATMTFTPALLFMTGRWAFWPKPGFRCKEIDGTVQPEATASQRNLFQPMWKYMGQVIERRPMVTLLLTLAAMIPLMSFGLYIYRDVSYGLLESLPKTATSTIGARALERHFPSGIAGPIQVVIRNSDVDFRNPDGISVIDSVAKSLINKHEELKIADIRSVANPLGLVDSSDHSEDSVFTRTVTRRVTRRRSVEHYVSDVEQFAGHVTTMEIIGTTNPFSLESIRLLDRLTPAIQAALPSDQQSKSEILLLGPTASVRDVNLISQSDQWRIYLLVVASVLLILIVLLRSIVVSLYLMVTVLLSYLATLGTTWLLFYGLDPHGFIGLDWTVPLFLFVVLIAIGEDYNIFLVTRIHDEQVTNGPTHGITVALARTGGIITSCGFIMAGTFASLGAGSLARMQQLAFALAFGVLLDTFVIRPILVPAFMVIMNSDRYGHLSRFLR